MGWAVGSIDGAEWEVPRASIQEMPPQNPYGCSRRVPRSVRCRFHAAAAQPRPAQLDADRSHTADWVGAMEQSPARRDSDPDVLDPDSLTDERRPVIVKGSRRSRTPRSTAAVPTEPNPGKRRFTEPTRS
jgi:hypothetical protein